MMHTYAQCGQAMSFYLTESMKHSFYSSLFISAMVVVTKDGLNVIKDAFIVTPLGVQPSFNIRKKNACVCVIESLGRVCVLNGTAVF